MEITVDIFYLILGFITVMIPVIAAILKLTAWGKANEEALDCVVDSVQWAMDMGSKTPANWIKRAMNGHEQNASPNAVKAWKEAVKKRKEKRVKKWFGGPPAAAH